MSMLLAVAWLRRALMRNDRRSRAGWWPALIFACAAVWARAEIAVWQPRQGAPAFAEPGGRVVVEIEGAAGVPAAGWRAAVRNDLRAWDCTVQAATQVDVRAPGRAGWRIELQVPREAPPELMDIVLANGPETAAACHALGVVRDLESGFYLLHLTDEHVREQRAAQSKEPHNGFRTAELVQWATGVVNLINPRFVVNSGDCTYQYESNGKQANAANLVQRYADAKAGYRVPSITVPGNHDVSRTGTPTHAEAAARWEAVLGPRCYSRRLGSLYVLGHDFHDETLRTAAAADYAASAADPAIRGRLIVQHFAAYLDPNAGDIFAFRPDASMPAPTLMLIGHVHVTRVEQAAPFPVLMTVAAHRSARAGFIELKKDAAGLWTCPTAKTWNPDSAFALVGDGGRPLVVASYSQPNDGTASANAVTIRNDLPRRFNDGRVRFLLTAGSYAVSGGEKLAEYTFRAADGNDRTAVVVRADLAAQAETCVTVRATATAAR